MLKKIIYVFSIWAMTCSAVYAVTENGISITYWRDNPKSNGVIMKGTFGKTANVFTAHTGSTTVVYGQDGTTTATSRKINVKGYEEFTLIVNSLNVGSGTNTVTLSGYKGTYTSNIVTVIQDTVTSQTIPIAEKYLDDLCVGYSSTGNGSNSINVIVIAGSKEK